MINPQLDKAILEILKQGSLSEFQLIKKLQQPPYSIFTEDLFNSELALFQTHFVIHNALYRLRDQGLANKEFDVDTLTTNLSLLKIASSEKTELTEQSRPEVIKLRTFYLDWSNFHNTEENDVVELLSNFWQRYSDFDAKKSQQHLLDEALKEFGFEQLPNIQELKKRYKKLSNQYHPDKGGSTVKFHQLQQHYQLILLFID